MISLRMPRLALVTGAAKRIGRAVALDLAQAGFDVAVHYSQSAVDAHQVVQDITAMGRRARAFQAELTDEQEVIALSNEVFDWAGPLGVLVNNASLFERDEVTDVTRISWDRHMEANLRAPFVLSQNMMERMPESGQGLIINLLDQRVWNLTPHFISYTLSKAGLWTLTQTLALALAPRIRVVGIGPGPALPSMRQTQQQFQAQCAATPLHCGTSPEEICAAVRFVLAAPSFTGQMIALDGGQHLNWAPVGAACDEE